MGCDDKVDCGRRRLLVATSVAGGVAGMAAAIPYVSTFAPSERNKSSGAPIEVDISKLGPGEMMTVDWNGKPTWILHRTKKMLDGIVQQSGRMADPKSDRSKQPGYAKNELRSIKPEYWVAIGICTHMGCAPADKFRTGAESGMGPEWEGGFLCPCHGSTFDLAGRVYKDKPAPHNLEVPPHVYLSNARILIGEDRKGA
jgi:ubiquinol-cytochrome c reductase iron-sulfur subunit